MQMETLLRQLNPKARIVRSSYAKVDLDLLFNTGSFDMAEAQEMPGWFQELEGGHVPESQEYGISSFVFRAQRPFDPERLDQFITAGLHGIIRSKGLLWVAGLACSLTWHQACHHAQPMNHYVDSSPNYRLSWGPFDQGGLVFWGPKRGFTLENYPCTAQGPNDPKPGPRSFRTEDRQAPLWECSPVRFGSTETSTPVSACAQTGKAASDISSTRSRAVLRTFFCLLISQAAYNTLWGSSCNDGAENGLASARHAWDSFVGDAAPVAGSYFSSNPVYRGSLWTLFGRSALQTPIHGPFFDIGKPRIAAVLEVVFPSPASKRGEAFWQWSGNPPVFAGKHLGRGPESASTCGRVVWLCPVVLVVF